MRVLSLSSYGGKRRHRPDNLDLSPDQTCFKCTLASCCVALSFVPPSQHRQAGSALVSSSLLLTSLCVLVCVQQLQFGKFWVFCFCVRELPWHVALEAAGQDVEGRGGDPVSLSGGDWGTAWNTWVSNPWIAEHKYDAAVLSSWRLFDAVNRMSVKHRCIELLIADFWDVTGK